MESQRNFLIIGLLLVSFLIYQQWQQDYGPQAPVTSTAQTTTVDSTTADVPRTDNVLSENNAPRGQVISVRSDVLDLSIALDGGDIISAKLLKHDTELDSNEPFVLLEQRSDFAYIAQSGLIGKDGPDAQAQRPSYRAAQSSYELAADASSLSIPLSYTDAKGNVFVKTFVLHRDSYKLEVNYHIDNRSSEALSITPFAQFKQSPTESGGSMVMPVYRGGAYSSDESRYAKYSFDDIEKKNLNVSTQGGWVAMMQHYFVTAWLPQENASNELYSKQSNGFAYMGYKGPMQSIAAGTQANVNSALWIGPKNQNEMADAAEHLNLTVDYGWLWFLAQPLYKLLTFFHSLVGNWGMAIIMITFTVKGLLYPLTKAQYTSMAKMRMLQPKLLEIRERYGDDRQKSSQAMMELYKKEKVNPLGGCLPLLLQMPIFIALYWSLMESVELRHAPFFGWIQDLSVQDPLFILPILMGASMFLIQKMSPTTVTDPMQQRIMTFMPVIFSVFFLFFPAGLVLYWLMSNVVTLIQQTLIYRNLEKKGLHSKNK